MSTSRVVVVGLGPAGPELAATAVVARVAEVPVRFLRTARHPAASLVPGASALDDVYEAAERIEDVYPAIVERLVAAAREHGEVLYAVPGSPAVAERTVELLVGDDRVAVEVLPALSFLDLAWVRLGVDPVATGVRVVDGHRFEVEAAGERGPLLVAQVDSPLVAGDVKLAIGEAVDRAGDHGGGLGRRPGDGGHQPPLGWVSGDVEVTVLQRLGLPDERIETLPWHELDRVPVDHLTSVWIPELAAPVAGEVARFATLVATLRAECPWDREQTHQSLKRHLIEEAYEVLEAIDGVDEATGDGYEHLEEELGDLLFQVLFHSTLAAEAGQFTLADVAATVHDKLRDRHPHVFGDLQAGTAEEVAAGWEQRKKAEKGRESVFDGIPAALPSLLFASKVQKKAATLDGGVAPPVPSLDEALDALASLADGDRRPPGGAGGAADAGRPEAVVGEALLAVVAAAREAGVDPETALRTAADRWRDEARARELGTDLPSG